MVKYGFFNSVNGDRLYNADDVSEFFKGVLSDGIFKWYRDSLEVVPGGGMTVQVLPGKAMLNSKYLHNTSALSLNISNSESSRTDLVVAFCDSFNRICGITVIENATTDPDSDSYKSIILAKISVTSSTAEILDTDIQDLREGKWVNLTALQSGIEEMIYSINTATYDSNISKYKININSMGYIPEQCTDIELYINGIKTRYGTDYTYSEELNNQYVVLENTGNYSYMINHSQASDQYFTIRFFKDTAMDNI